MLVRCYLPVSRNPLRIACRPARIWRVDIGRYARKSIGPRVRRSRALASAVSLPLSRAALRMCASDRRQRETRNGRNIARQAAAARLVSPSNDQKRGISALIGRGRAAPGCLVPPVIDQDLRLSSERTWCTTCEECRSVAARARRYAPVRSPQRRAESARGRAPPDPTRLAGVPAGVNSNGP